MEEVEWTPRQPRVEDLRVGLISWAGSYLTYEPYKNTVTATAKGLGRRQVTEQTCTGTLFPGSQAVCVCVCVSVCLCVCTRGYIFDLITFLASAIVRSSLAFAHRLPLLHLPVSKPVPRGKPQPWLCYLVLLWLLHNLYPSTGELCYHQNERRRAQARRQDCRCPGSLHQWSYCKLYILVVTGELGLILESAVGISGMVLEREAVTSSSCL